MRIPFLLFLSSLFCLLVAGQAIAQCSPAPRLGGTTFPYGVTDSVTPLHGVPGPFLVCDNADLYYYGNNPDTIYLEGSARLRVASCWNLVVYMRNNCQLRCDSAAAMLQFRAITYDPTFTSFVDTAGATILSLTACTGLGYDYSAWPGGANNCATATALEPIHTLAQATTFPNPGTESLQVSAGMSCEAALLGMDGRILLQWHCSQGTTTQAVGHLPRGVYILRLETKGQRTLRRIVLQ